MRKKKEFLDLILEYEFDSQYIKAIKILLEKLDVERLQDAFRCVRADLNGSLVISDILSKYFLAVLVEDYNMHDLTSVAFHSNCIVELEFDSMNPEEDVNEIALRFNSKYPPFSIELGEYNEY